MAKTKDIFTWTLKKEGGLSRAKTDSARAYPAPYEYTYNGVTASDWHTNKGVTWETFEDLADTLGYDDDPENFFEMPYEIWSAIAKRGYWDKFNLDTLKSQSIANLIFQSAYGSGNAGALKMWNKYFGTSFTKGSELTAYINKYISKKSSVTLFKKMWKYRLDWLLSLKGQSANYEGWKKRAISLYELSLGKTPVLNGDKSLMEGYSLVDKLMAAGFVWIGFQVGKRIF